MQLSTFEKLVLSDIIAGDPEQTALTKQIVSATVRKRDYTGVGLYTELIIDSNTPRLEKSHRLIEGRTNTHLTHPALPAGAGALLWFSDGYANTLECYTFDGDWPSNESEFSVA